MCEPITHFGQSEYTRVLDNHGARRRSLSQSGREAILMEHGADYEQAKNGAYVYIHHARHQIASRPGTQEQYDRLLDGFGARRKRPMECIRFLESQGFSYADRRRRPCTTTGAREASSEAEAS
jgi:hypothetical protein